MRKRNLLFPLVVSSLFIPSLESIQSTTVFNSFENENISYEEVDAIPLASSSSTGGGGSGGGSGGGGGGARKSKQQQKNLQKNKIKAQEAAKKRIEAKKSNDAESKKRIEAKKSNDAESKEKIAISKLDTDAGIGRDDMKDETKELTAKVAIASISNISAKILKLEDEFRNYNPTSPDDFLKKADEIKSKINALEVLQDKIDDFLNFNIDNVVNMLSLFDQFLDEPVFTNAEVIEKSNEFGVKYSSLVEELKAAGIYDEELRLTPGTLENYLFSMRQQTQQYFKTLILLKFLKR